jgi:hypothetical protein
MADMPSPLALHGRFDPIKIEPHESANSLNRNFTLPIRTPDRLHTDLQRGCEFINGQQNLLHTSPFTSVLCSTGGQYPSARGDEISL